MNLAALIAALCSVSAFGQVNHGTANGGFVTPQAPVVSSVTITSLTPGSIVFATSPASGILGQDNANFFWNEDSQFLGIKTNAPLYPLDVNGGAHIRGAQIIDSSMSLTGTMVIEGSNGMRVSSSTILQNWNTQIYNHGNGLIIAPWAAIDGGLFINTDNNGFVGIPDTVNAPKYQLDIVGSEQISNQLIVKGSASITNLVLISSGIRFPDGLDILTSVSQSSEVFPTASVATAQTGNIPTFCLTGSSATVASVNNRKLEMNFMGAFTSSVISDGCNISITLDGVFATGPFSNAKPMMQGLDAVASDNTPFYLHYVTTNTFSGSHTACLAFSAQTGGTCTITCGASPCMLELREYQ